MGKGSSPQAMPPSMRPDLSASMFAYTDARTRLKRRGAKTILGDGNVNSGGIPKQPGSGGGTPGGGSGQIPTERPPGYPPNQPWPPPGGGSFVGGSSSVGQTMGDAIKKRADAKQMIMRAIPTALRAAGYKVINK